MLIPLASVLDLASISEMMSTIWCCEMCSNLREVGGGVLVK